MHNNISLVKCLIELKSLQFFFKKKNQVDIHTYTYIFFFEIDSIEDIYFYIVDCVAVYTKYKIDMLTKLK